MADIRHASINEADVAMPVEQRERRDVAVARGERDAEGFPELRQLVGCPGGEGPRCVDALRVGREHRWDIRCRIGRHLGNQHVGRQLLLLELLEQRRVERTCLMARGVESRDHDILARDRAVVESTSSLVDEGERRHRPELARQLSETQVDLIVAGVRGSNEETPRFDPEQERFHLAGNQRNGH